MSDVPMDTKSAVNYGEVIQAVYSQFANEPTELNPSEIASLPSGYTLERTIQMKDFIVDPIEEEKFYGCLVKGGDPITQVIAIRGTLTYTEWWDNLHFLPVPFSRVEDGGNVAEGFYNIYNSLTTMNPANVDEPPSGLFDKIDPNVPVIVTGHSLGAALATLLVTDMSANTALKPQGWTFASPKVGDTNFAAAYGRLTTVSWRIYNIPDIVPRVPVDPFDEYQHVNTGYPINSKVKTRWSFGCYHSLSTYLNVLSDGAVPIRSECQPSATPANPL